ncbi:hypothetical protein GCK72_021123 [Caenorhabditis remanei]|uniref:DUF38 domain-containing protein n=1 Tax=Caenorhabditis remanei TaxID=31234 RepID=A0A6A5GH97_CAERE|nr:hypothetical protein GCK72_021123 [Caenorhabditis remanei]KAF1754560.1 hypothetical protein GCK72_021123 [Caenorhabditis remanei]
MPFAYDHIDTRHKDHAVMMSFSFNDQEAQSTIWRAMSLINNTEFHYKHIGGSAGVSTVVTYLLDEYLIDDYFISVFCEDVEAFVRHQIKTLSYLSLDILDTDGDQKVLEPIFNRICRCLEKSLESRTEKLKVEHLSLPVLKINQAEAAVNLLDRDILRKVTVILPFKDQVFTADDFIPLIEGQGWQMLDLRIKLHELSFEVFEKMKKLLTSTSNKLNCIIIDFETIDDKCIEFIEEPQRLLDGKTVKLIFECSKNPVEEMTMIPSIMRSIVSSLGSTQIQSLRKVSRGIRHCLDYIKPDPQILAYYLVLKKPSGVSYDELMNEEIWARYKGSLEQEADRIVNNFELKTRHQKRCMDWLLIGMDKKIWKSKEEEESVMSKFFKGIRDVLISRSSPLKVNTLTLMIHRICLVMDILPYLDTESLSGITLRRIEGIDEECTIELDEVSKTEQWSKAKNLPQSPVFQKFQIYIKNCLAADFLGTLGEPYRVVNNCKYIWYFRIENTSEYLHVTLEQIPLQTGGRLHFARVHHGETPFF